jgi:glucose/arabinose dehydrogenase
MQLPRLAHAMRSGSLALAGLMLAATAACAQDSTTAVPAAADTVQPAAAEVPAGQKPSATGNMLKSLVVPGWGQLSLGRELTALVFIAGEAGTLTMVIKSQKDLDRARDAGDAELIDQYTRKREDWLVYMGINHVLSALEAYVSAKLWDFPGDLDLQVTPGGVGAAVRIPLHSP